MFLHYLAETPEYGNCIFSLDFYMLLCQKMRQNKFKLSSICSCNTLHLQNDRVLSVHQDCYDVRCHVINGSGDTPLSMWWKLVVHIVGISWCLNKY